MTQLRHLFTGFFIALFMLVSAGTITAAAQDMTPQETEAIHNELRALRDRAVAALKARDPDALMNELTDDIAFTAMNNEVVHGKQAAVEYYERMMEGASSIVQEMDVSVEPDVMSLLYGDGKTAVSTGDSVAYFKIRGGLEFTAPLRWTATLVDEGDGWKIASMHFSSNIFDNPIDAGIARYLWLLLGAAALIGLVVGFLLGRLRRAR